MCVLPKITVRNSLSQEHSLEIHYCHNARANVRTFIGSDPSIQESTYDTRFPLNIYDEDIDPSMKEPPEEREGATEMIFDLLRYTVSTTARRMNYAPPGPGKCAKKAEMFTLERKERLMEELHQHCEDKYLKHCDMSNPLHWVAGTVFRLILAKMWLVIHHPLQREDADNKELSDETKDRLFRTSVDIIQWSNHLEREPTTRKWGWLFRTYVQWHAVAFVLSQLCFRTKGHEADRAWQVINEIFSDIGGLVSPQKRGMLWKPLRRLIARAQAVRARELEKQKMFPLDGSLGPTAASLNAAMDPMSMSNDGPTNFSSLGYDGGLPTLNNPVPGNPNGLQTYPPMDDTPQLGTIDQNEWMYNDPAFPHFNLAADGNMGTMGQNGMEFPTNGALGGGDRSGSELNWSDWDEMMKDLPMGTEGMTGFGGAVSGSGNGSGPVMGGDDELVVIVIHI